MQHGVPVLSSGKIPVRPRAVVLLCMLPNKPITSPAAAAAPAAPAAAAVVLYLSVSRSVRRAHLCVTLCCCGFPPGSETDRNGLSMLNNELSPAQSPSSKVRTQPLIGQPLQWLS